jgi:AcrR family transcriptional regulator
LGWLFLHLTGNFAVMQKKRKQQERRESTQHLLLESARRLFGQRGYDATSLEDIARDCNLTTGPIYHYFENKKALFQAVHDAELTRTVEIYSEIMGPDLKAHFQLQLQATLDVYRDAEVFRILMIDAPGVLGDEHWTQARFVEQMEISLQGEKKIDNPTITWFRILHAAVREAIVMVANSTTPDKTRQQVTEILNPILAVVAEHIEASYKFKFKS